MSSRPDSSSQKVYSQGLQAYKAASYETAVDLFTEVSIQFSQKLSWELSLTSSWNCLQAIQLEPKNPKCYDARASAYDKLERLQDALLDARDVIRLVPASSKVRFKFRLQIALLELTLSISTGILASCKAVEASEEVCECRETCQSRAREGFEERRKRRRCKFSTSIFSLRRLS
jgi:tetratricopeptide (TPR) repeat protein